jgi:hypothetical protein
LNHTKVFGPPRFFAALRAASRIIRASPSVPASGFSHATCFPASSIAIEGSAWTSFGVATSTSSTSGSRASERQSVVDFAQLHRRANAASSRSSRPATVRSPTVRGSSKKRFTCPQALLWARPMNF